MNNPVQSPVSRYRVNFKGRGFTVPDVNNPKGIRVTASGYMIVPAERPKSNLDIPMSVIEHCKKIFMQETRCVRYAGDNPVKGKQCFPTVWLGKIIAPKK